LGLTAVAQQESPMAALLLDLWIMFIEQRTADQRAGVRKQKGGARMFSRDMVAALNNYTNRPWSVLRRGKAVTDMWLSEQLRPYEVKPRTIWIGDVAARGYMEGDFLETFRRYIPKSALQAVVDNAQAARKPPQAEEEG
jgi:hypothetical protein